jgi:SAM-dependent methyltransferase
LLDFLGDVRNKKVLDIGSSNAVYLRQLDAEFRVAFDLVHAYLKVIPDISGLARVCGDAEELPFKAGFFDVIIVSDILEHLLKPDRLIQSLTRVCRPDTRIIVHVPWEEDISHYRDSKYEFAHLRSFDSYTFAELWRDYYIRRTRATYPSLEEPIVFKLADRIPRTLYNFCLFVYYHRELAYREYRWRERWIAELPKRERWLLWFYRPKFRIFELRVLEGSRIVTVFDHIASWLGFRRKDGQARR